MYCIVIRKVLNNKDDGRCGIFLSSSLIKAACLQLLPPSTTATSATATAAGAAAASGCSRRDSSGSPTSTPTSGPSSLGVLQCATVRRSFANRCQFVLIYVPYYFSRLTLSAGNVSFVDRRVTFQEWQEMKPGRSNMATRLVQISYFLLLFQRLLLARFPSSSTARWS